MAGNAFATKLAALLADTVKTYLEVRDIGLLLKNMPQVNISSVAGNAGSTVDVTTEGDPRAVIAVNTNSGCGALKISGMATSSALKLKASDNSIAYGANMITLGTNKFTIGNDSDFNETQTIVYIAFI